MKHVFGVSSHLAFYLCHRLIQIDAIPVDDCIFFTTRDYMIPREYQSIYTQIIRTSYNVSATNGRIFAGWRIWRTIKNVQDFDSLVDQEIRGEDFLWYTQVCFNDICSLMVSKPNCRGYYVIEDGSGSYRKENKPTFTGIKGLIYHFLLKPLFPRLFIVKNHMIETEHHKFKGCIASNDMCFPLHKQYTRVIGIPFVPVPLAKVPDAIISIDPLFLWISQEDAECLFQRLAAFVNSKGYKYIVYKHHPYNLSSAHINAHRQYNEWIKHYFTANLQELDSQVSLENTIMAHQCDFYTAVSSVAIYAKAMGVVCYSYMPIIREYAQVPIHIVEELCIPIE